MLIDNLIGVENILPDVENCVGVAECQYYKVGIHTEDAFDVFRLLFDVMCMNWPIGAVTYLA